MQERRNSHKKILWYVGCDGYGLFNSRKLKLHFAGIITSFLADWNLDVTMILSVRTKKYGPEDQELYYVSLNWFSWFILSFITFILSVLARGHLTRIRGIIASQFHSLYHFLKDSQKFLPLMLKLGGEWHMRFNFYSSLEISMPPAHSFLMFEINGTQ